MLDPVEAFRTLSTYRPTSTVGPVPTVIPTSPPIYQEAGDAGKRALWVVCILMGLSSLAFYALAWRTPVQKRILHILTAFITTFAFISYYAMAIGDGVSYHSYTETHKSKLHHGPDYSQKYNREVYWARYVDWSLTTPLLLIDLALVAGLNGASILVAVIADLIMILTGLFSAFAKDGAPTWGFYAIACIAYLTILWHLIYNGRAIAMSRDARTGKFFTAIAGFTFVIWTIYPIIWGFADGSHHLSLDSEIIIYAILDILAKPVFGFWLLLTHDRMPHTGFTLDGFWANGISKEGTIRIGDEENGA
ncbi:MAG: hypothetical protein M1834_006384 [Cirrosporium novae-zelandiae]|nr:MAG: hypothetical protein M1834_006384 [Cirrosporium novae-zelandiae]